MPYNTEIAFNQKKKELAKERSKPDEVGCKSLLGKDDLKLCPFCGDAPDLATDGSCIDIECCVSMGRQKCDYLTIEQRTTKAENGNPYEYCNAVEAYVLDKVIAEWNTRNPA